MHATEEVSVSAPPKVEIETVTVPLQPDLVEAMERSRARWDALLESLTESARARIEAAERQFERQLLYGDDR